MLRSRHIRGPLTSTPNSPQADSAGQRRLLAYRLEQRDVALNLLSPLVGGRNYLPHSKRKRSFGRAKSKKGRAHPIGRVACSRSLCWHQDRSWIFALVRS